MVGYKIGEEDLKKITKLWKKLKNVTAVTQEFCKKKDLEYNDSSRRRVSHILAKKGLTKSLKEVEKEEASLEEDYSLAKQRVLGESKYYIVTWEQNKTPLHENLWRNILKYKEFLGAELSVVLGRYKNPTSVFYR